MGQVQQPYINPEVTTSGDESTPHVITEVASNHPLVEAYTLWLIGGSEYDADLAAGATLTSAATDMTRIRLDHATLVLQISDTSGTIDVDVDMVASEDGISNTFTVAGLISNKTGNGSYTLKLDNSAYIYNHFPKFQVVEQADSSGSCDVKLYIMARGG